MAASVQGCDSQSRGTCAFFDLRCNEVDLEPLTQRERVAHALSLGYDGIALAHQAGPRVTDADECTFQQVEVSALLTTGRAVQEAVQQAHKRTAAHGNAYAFRQLTRIDIPTDDVNAAQAACSSATVLGTYDLVAVQPCSERALAQACTTLDVDIISLDLSKRLSYRFKPATVQAAMRRGIHFEIAYTPLLRDPGSRKQLLANAQALCRETRGRNIIVSSGARTVMELRGPHDVINLATFLGMSQQQAQEALGRNALRVLQRARERRAYRGTLLLTLQPAGRESVRKEAATSLGAISSDARKQAEPASMDVD